MELISMSGIQQPSMQGCGRPCKQVAHSLHQAGGGPHLRATGGAQNHFPIFLFVIKRIEPGAEAKELSLDIYPDTIFAGTGNSEKAIEWMTLSLLLDLAPPFAAAVTELAGNALDSLRGLTGRMNPCHISRKLRNSLLRPGWGVYENLLTVSG